MTARSSRPDPLPPRPLSKWIIRVGTLIVFAVTVVVVVVSWFVLRRLYGGQGAQIQLDVIRTAGTLVIGTGGAVALLLTARWQRYTELVLVHTDRDATERRTTELYTKAADSSVQGRLRCGWPVCTPWSVWRTAPSSTARPSWR